MLSHTPKILPGNGYKYRCLSRTSTNPIYQNRMAGDGEKAKKAVPMEPPLFINKLIAVDCHAGEIAKTDGSYALCTCDFTRSCVLRFLSSFGNRISNIPCFSWASASSITTSSGRRRVRENEPQKSSRWK